MAKKQLHIVTNAYRGTLEEQDDTVVWLCHAMRGADADLDVLLEDNAVIYGVRGQEVPRLSFGSRQQRNAVDVPGELERLTAKGVCCFYVEDDARTRGVGHNDLIEGLAPIARADLPQLFDRYDQVHRW